MTGIALSIIAALLFAFGDVGKKKLSESIHPYVISWIPVTFGVILGSLYFSYYGFPAHDITPVVPYILIAGVLLVTIELVFIRSISIGELSLVLPIMSFIPILSGLFAWFLTGEAPSLLAFIGMLITVVASWLIFADTSDLKHVLRPFRRMFSEESPRLMLLFCLLNGIFVNVMNIGGDEITSMYFLWLVLIFEWLILNVLILLRGVDPISALAQKPALGLATGACWAGGMAFLFESLSRTLVSYSLAAFRTHTLFGILLGYLFFKERDLEKRISAAILMMVGITILLVCQ
jgi:drug/metabolite transporter (DMT)-like permease